MKVAYKASSGRTLVARSLCTVSASKSASTSSLGAAKTVSGRYSKVSRVWSAKSAQKSQAKFQNLSARSYSTTTPHPAEDAAATPVAVLDTLTKQYPASSITQESMLLKLEDLVPLPNTFAVVHIGGQQVRRQILSYQLLSFKPVHWSAMGRKRRLKKTEFESSFLVTNGAP